MNKVLMCCLCIFLFSYPSISQSGQMGSSDSTWLDQTIEEIVVTGTRYKLPVENSGKTIFKLTKKDIERNAGKTLADLINEVPGVHIDGNYGSPGTNVSYFVRGGRNKSTLILIDGIPMNDPSAITPFFDLRLLSLNQVESIEILKGGLSTLYGTGAAAAVINITLKDAEAQNHRGVVDLNYGSYNTFNAHVSRDGNFNGIRYLVSASNLFSQGFSSALDTNQVQEFDKDGINKRNSILKLGYDFTEKFSLNGLVSFDAFEVDFDNGAFSDAENMQFGELLKVGLKPRYVYKRGVLELKTMYSFNTNRFEGVFPIAYKGRNLQLDLNNKHQLTNRLTSFAGVELQQLNYEEEPLQTFDNTKFSSIAPYGSFLYQVTDAFNIHAGLRLNNHSTYGSNWVYNLNPNYTISATKATKIKLYSSVSSSYITPTGFQLFSFLGNQELEPEESLNYEIGTGIFWDQRFSWNLAFFTREENNTIGFVSEFDDEGNFIGGTYQNVVGTRNVSGVETDFKYDISKKYTFAGNYTLLNDPELASEFYRIPKHKIGFTFDMQPVEQTTISIKYTQVGARDIFDFGSFSELTLDSYSLFDVFANYSLMNDTLEIYGALNNILDKDFVGVHGFTTRGRNFSFGLRFSRF